MARFKKSRTDSCSQSSVKRARKSVALRKKPVALKPKPAARGSSGKKPPPTPPTAVQNRHGLSIPKAPFERLVKESINGNRRIARGKSAKSKSKAPELDALDAAQQATEHYMVEVLEDTGLCATHAKR